MHTAALLAFDMFEVEIAGIKTSADELLDWGSHDRLGVVVTEPFGGLGASLMIQLATVCFFDVPGAGRRHQPLYPEIYLFHVGGSFGNFGAFDFWPPRKEIFVEGDAIQVLAQINNTGITHLLVPDGPAQATRHHWKEPDAAADRLKACFAYDAAGQAENADILLRGIGAAPIENSLKTLYPKKMLEYLASRTLPPLQRADNGRIVESYRHRAGEVPNSIQDGLALRFLDGKAKGFLEERYRRVDVSYALARLRIPN